MKRTVTIVSIAVLLTGCFKGRPIIEPSSSIVFAPDAVETKALLLPESGNQENNWFPTSESFNVYAFADLGNGVKYNSPLMEDINISCQGNEWKATSGTFLWPSSGTVDFYAYYPEAITSGFSSDGEHPALKFYDVNVGNIVGSQIDPLVGVTLSQIAPTKPVVNLVFKHATSQIAATVSDATTNPSLKGKISIRKVVFRNMATKGNYTDGTVPGKGAWTDVGGKSDIVLFSGNETVSGEERYLSSTGFMDVICNNSAFVVIPETLFSGEGAQSIDITYSVSSYTNEGFTYPEISSKTVSVPLYDSIENNRLLNGRRYVFHIGITLDGPKNEIQFIPSVDGWKTEDVPGFTISAINAEIL